MNIIKDAGNCSYPWNNIVSTSFRARLTMWYCLMGKDSLGNNSIMVPCCKEIAIYDGWWKHEVSIGNGTGPMSDKLIRNFRHFLWLDKVVLVIDDLESYEQGSYEWLWHTNGKTWNNNGRLSVENGNAAVDILPLYPALMVPSGFVHDYPTYLYITEHKGPIDHHQDQMESYYGLNLPQKQRK